MNILIHMHNMRSSPNFCETTLILTKRHSKKLSPVSPGMHAVCLGKEQTAATYKMLRMRICTYMCLHGQLVRLLVQ